MLSGNFDRNSEAKIIFFIKKQKAEEYFNGIPLPPCKDIPSISEFFKSISSK